MSFDTRRQGDIGELAAAYYYATLGYHILWPQTVATPYDILLESPDGDFTKVQCKTTARRASRSYVANLVTSGGNRSWNGIVKYIDPAQVDLVFIWCADQTFWEFSASELQGKRSVALGPDKAEHCVHGVPCWAPEFVEPDDDRLVVQHTPAPARLTKACPSCGGPWSGRGSCCRSCADEARGWSIPKASGQKPPKPCPGCGTTEWSGRGKLCRKCDAKTRIEATAKAAWPPLDELRDMVAQTSYEAVGRELGVTGAAVRKHIAKRTTTQ